ncbi:MAG: glycosyltransferase family A protein [Acutalibacteraceae bacterium]
MEKTLSISIAAYNVEEFLKNTLDSLVAPEIMDDIEVLIIDDGSKDNTAAIGKEFEDKYPNSFKVISKPNGGYGSTINAAIDAATGQYFKTLDGDDWYDTENLVRFVKDLKNMSADLILTPFTMVYEGTGEKQVISMERNYQEKNITFEQFLRHCILKLKCIL